MLLERPGPLAPPAPQAQPILGLVALEDSVAMEARVLNPMSLEEPVLRVVMEEMVEMAAMAVLSVPTVMKELLASQEMLVLRVWPV